MSMSKFFFSAIFALFAAWPSAAEATVVMKLNRAEMTRMSEVVVRARVGGVTVREEAPGRLNTLIELETIERFKGAAEALIVVQQVGGVLGDWHQTIAGQNTYRVGEELVLFLDRLPSGRYVTVGIGIGRFVVERRADGTVVANEDLGHVTFAAAAADGVIRPTTVPPAASLSLTDLRRELDGYLRRSR